MRRRSRSFFTTDYCRLNGSYANLIGGLLPDAMEDLTGGVVESIDFNDKYQPKDLLRVLQLYAGRCVLMGCHADVSTHTCYYCSVYVS